MKKRVGAAVMLVLIAGLGAALFSGCGGVGNEGRGEQVFASEIEDGAEKYDRSQYNCPVCEGQPIVGDYYAEVDGKRIYFDKKECETKFKENPDRYVGDMESYRERQMEEMRKRMQAGQQSGQQ